MKSLTMIGAYPPPAGGNSVHIERLCNAFVSKNYQCNVFDLFSDCPLENPNPNIRVYRFQGSVLSKLLACENKLQQTNSDIIHIHVSSMNNFAYVGHYLLKSVPSTTRIIITIHSGSFVQHYSNFNPVKKWLATKLLSKCHHIIAVGKEQADFIQHTIFHSNSSNVSVIPAYLPPESHNSEKTRKFLTQLNTNKKIIISSGFGVPLYGFEKIITAYKKSTHLQENYQLVFCLYNTFDEDYISQLLAMIENLDIYIDRDFSANEFAYLLQQSDIYVRATDRDGDAVAIRESHYFGLAVVASNAIIRPDFCHIFFREDTDSLLEAINQAISNPLNNKISSSTLDPIIAIENIYLNNL